MTDRLAGRYELVAKIADGALAALWRGTLHAGAGFSRPVAVRIVRDPWDRAVIGAWASTASQLAEHATPHLESLLDFVVADGRAVVVSEWIEGVSVRRWVRAHVDDGRTVAWPLATCVALGVLRALEGAERAAPPIRHEGIDARCVRIAADGTVKLTRFGVGAALAARGTGRRELEELALRQAAPELVDGGSSSPASDRFALGALLFEMLAGRPAFDAPPGEARDALVRAGEVPDLTAIRPDVPSLLVSLIERALRVEPSERFDSAAAMIRAFVQLLRSHPEPTGADALAASVRPLVPAPPRPEHRPRGLVVVEPTIHVGLAELTPMDEESAEPNEPERRTPYHFPHKEPRRSSVSSTTTRLELQEGDAEPLPLTRRTQEPKPLGLSPQRTEFLDGDQVDRLTIPDARRDGRFATQKTDLIDADQLDALTIRERDEP